MAYFIIHVNPGSDGSHKGKGLTVAINREVVRDRELVTETTDSDGVKTKGYYIYHPEREVRPGDVYRFAFGPDEELIDGVQRFAQTIASSSKAAAGRYSAGFFGNCIHLYGQRAVPITVQATSDTLTVAVVAQ